MSVPTEAELLIINSIIYTFDFLKNTDKVSSGKSIYKWACDFDVSNIKNGDLPAEINRLEFENIINTIKSNQSTYSNMIIKNIDNTQYASIDGGNRVVNVTIQYNESLIVAYKGTGGPIEWRDNGVGGYSNVTETAQQKQALSYYDEMMKKYNSDEKMNVYVTGHSKGGNKAQYIGVLRGDQEMFVGCYSFDGQGFNQAFLKKYKDKIEKSKSKITSICNEYDFVSILLCSVAGNTKYIRNNSSFGTEWDIADALKHKFGGFHSPYSMFTTKNMNGEDILFLNEMTEQSSVMKELQELLQYYQKYMNEEDWRFLCFNMMGLFMDGEKSMYGGDYSEMPDGFFERLISLTKGYTQKTKGISFGKAIAFLYPLFGGMGSIFASIVSPTTAEDGYALITRDFSDEVRDNLLSIVEEVDDEPWYDPTRWDVFYRIEDLCGQLDFPSNQNELRTYYRKLIDKQGMSAKEIRYIFKEVYELDNSFSNEISDINDKIKKIDTDLKLIVDKFSFS